MHRDLCIGGLHFLDTESMVPSASLRVYTCDRGPKVYNYSRIHRALSNLGEHDNKITMAVPQKPFCTDLTGIIGEIETD